jgi:hypothetical protein
MVCFRLAAGVMGVMQEEPLGGVSEVVALVVVALLVQFLVAEVVAMRQAVAQDQVRQRFPLGDVQIIVIPSTAEMGLAGILLMQLYRHF